MNVHLSTSILESKHDWIKNLHTQKNNGKLIYGMLYQIQ